MALLKDGFLNLEELAELPGVPSEERQEEGAVAVIECAQEIPCNPCEELCPHGAIKVGKPITNLPVLDEDLCTGCGLCIAGCPGQAIFVVDRTYSDDDASVQMPYEFLPIPEKGSLVEGLNRAGESVCSVRVLKVSNPKSYDRTRVIRIAVPKELAMEVRSIAVTRK